jgi:hypothetical protein
VIPALLALPMVEGVAGGIAGSVAKIFSPSEPTAPAPAASVPFATALSRVTPAIPSANAPGIMRADQWNQMSGLDLRTWARSLTGHHIDATDAAGHTVSGTVQGVQQAGDSVALNVGGHLVSLSQLKQINWSALPA